MDFNLTPEQGMLQDSLRKFLSKEYGFESRRARAASTEGFSRATWVGPFGSSSGSVKNGWTRRAARAA